MALFVEFKPILGEIARYLRIIATKDCCRKPTAGTQALGNPLTLSTGFTTLKIKKTIATGTVTVTFPDSSTYVLSADQEELVLESPSVLGQFSINAAGGATYKFFTV
jgi:hypothetical protein